jgi:hypothetical protein
LERTRCLHPAEMPFCCPLVVDLPTLGVALTLRHHLPPLPLPPAHAHRAASRAAEELSGYLGHKKFNYVFGAVPVAGELGDLVECVGGGGGGGGCVCGGAAAWGRSWWC